MRSSIEYRKAIPGTEEFSKLVEFAKSFEHEIYPHPNVNVFAHYRDGVLFGYSDHVYLPTCYPAFHPKFTKPGDVIKIMSDWKAHTQLSGTPGFIAVPSNNNNGAGNFPDHVMEKLGLTKLNRELYMPE